MNIAYIANPNSIHDCKWINHFAKQNEVIVVCPTNTRSQKSYLSEKVTTYPILPVYSVLKIFQRKRTEKQLRQILEKNKIQIIHSMYAVPNALWGDSVSSSNHIITTRGSDILIDYAETFHSPKSLKEKFSFWIMRRRIGSSLNNATFITSTSLKQKREIEKIVYNKEKLHLIRTGVDRSAFRINESGFKKEDKFVIFSPRSMKPIYNIELLIRGVATFVENSRNSNLDVELRIIDDVPGSSYSKRVRNLIKNENFDTFTKVLPKLSLNEMKENYGECNLVVMIPKSDGTPVSAIEAMLLKKPLLMGALDYDDDLFNEKTVWQIKDFTEKSIRNEIIEINEHRNIQENKVENAFQLALENASLQNSLSKIENLYINSTSNANSFKFNK